MEADTDKQSFSLIEIFILVIILGILAAVVMPQISQASNEARLSDLVSRLQGVRSQIALYRIQHDDLLPGQAFPGGDITEAGFIKAMTTKGPGNLGPYLRKIPDNPFVDSRIAGSVTCVNDPDAVLTCSKSAGWWLNAATGQFRASDSSAHAVY